MTKRLGLSIIIAILAGIVMCLAVACVGGTDGVLVEDPSKPYENVVAVKVESVRSTYYLGESLDFSEYKVKLELRSGEVKEEYLTSANTSIDSDYVDDTGIYFYKLGETSFTVRYGSASTVYTVNVIEPTVLSVALKSQPNKQEYIEGESLDMDGCKLELTLDSGKKVVVFVSTGFVSGFDSSSLGVKTLSIKYFGRTVETNVSVRAKKVASVSIATAPTVKEYIVKSADADTTFIPAGMSLRRNYDNGTFDIVDVAEITAQMQYVYDFTAYNPQCPVTVKYTDAATAVIYEMKTYVAVNSKVPSVVTVSQLPTNYDNVIEGADDMDYTGGKVSVLFAGMSTAVEYDMNSPIFTKSGFVNTVGTCTITISYYNNNREGWSTTMDVTVKEKSPASIRLTNTAEALGTTYYAGLDRNVNINSLRYVVTYDNGTESAEQNVTQSMISDGNLSCLYYDADTKTKSITFTYGLVSAVLTVPMVDIEVSHVTLTSAPSNKFVSSGAAINLSGANLRAIYNYGDERNFADFGVSFVAGDTSAAALNTNRAAGEYTVYAYLDNCWQSLDKNYQTFKITITDNKPDQFGSIVNYPKTDYLYGETLVLTGLKFTMIYNTTTYTFTVQSEDNTAEGGGTVAFVNDQNAEVWTISKTNFIANGSVKVYAAGEVRLNFYGISFGYTVYVLPLQAAQIRVKESASSKTVYSVGESYDPTGLVMEIRNNNNATEFVTPTAWQAATDLASVSADGWYYVAGSGATAGIKSVTLVYQKGDLQLSCMLSNIVYNNNGINRIALYNGTVAATSLGTVARGLTPYINSYIVRAYYDATQYYQVTLSLDMLNYTTKDTSIGIREVKLSYNGLELTTSVDVVAATLSGISIKTYPKISYIVGEALNLTGGVLYRTYTGDVLPQDEVALSEAKITGYSLSPNFYSQSNKTLPLTVEYGGKTTTFNVTVWDKVMPTVNFGALTHFFGNNTAATVTFVKPDAIFELPLYSLVYQQLTDSGWVDLASMPVRVGNYRVVFRSQENRYYYESDTAAEYYAEYVLQKKSIEIIATPANKYYGDVDAVLGYTTTDTLWSYAINTLGVAATGNVTSAGLTVGGVHAAAGRYPITVGTLAHPYFEILFSERDYVVRPKEIKLTASNISDMRLVKQEGVPVSQSVALSYAMVNYSTQGSGYALGTPTETQFATLTAAFGATYYSVTDGGSATAIAATEVKNIGNYRVVFASLSGNYAISSLSDGYNLDTSVVELDFQIKKMLRPAISAGRNNIILTETAREGYYSVKLKNFADGFEYLTYSTDGETYYASGSDGSTTLEINAATQFFFKYSESDEYEESSVASCFVTTLQAG